MEGRKEIPSQLDDLNRDRKMDELVFVADLPAHGRKNISGYTFFGKEYKDLS